MNSKFLINSFCLIYLIIILLVIIENLNNFQT